jgi:penicillin-binding protein 1A
MSRALRQRRQRFRRLKARRRTLVASCMIGAAACVAIGAYGVYLYIVDGEAMPSTKTLKPERIGQNSVIYAADGSRMGVIRSDQNRSVIELDEMGTWMPRAIVAIEDRRFYSHDGVDVEGVARAAVKNAQAGAAVEGGSTITQQVVRNLYREISAEKTLRRKAKEAWLAQDLERTMEESLGSREKAKEWVLQTYLNLVFFGNNAYGVEAAAQTYFSKSANELKVQEAALLAGLPQLPSTYDPFKNPAEAKRRRDEVLAAMYRDRTLDARAYQAAVAAPVRLNPGKIYKEHRLPYFFDYVQEQMIKQYGPVTARQGGLRIRTTISPKLQRLAERAIKETLNQPGDPSAAMVVLNTRTGEIKAMASSEDYTRTQFNRAAQARRQPGSTAKIWVLAAFVKNQINPDSTSYVSRPIKVRYKGATEWWEPKTYDGSYRGSSTIRRASVASDNSVYAQMTLDISPEEVARTARQMGITSPLEHVWSIGLGSQVVTPLEQTSFYSTIARGGVRLDPTGIAEVQGPSNNPIPLPERRRKRVLTDWQAWKVVDILYDNMTGGTGTGAYISAAGDGQSGKTGTTDNHKDAWFCGMTPELTACVWMGYNTPRPMYSVHGIRVAGGTFPATMWKKFMDPALQVVRDRPWFTVTGMENWLPFTSTWMRNPSFDSVMGADPTAKPKDEEKEEDEERAGADGEDTPAARPTPQAAPAPPAPTPPPAPGGTGGGAPPAGGGAPGGGAPPAGGGAPGGGAPGGGGATP